jgi:hypothetical protein
MMAVVDRDEDSLEGFIGDKDGGVGQQGRRAALFSSIPRRVDLPNITHMSALRSDGPMQPSDRKREYGETQHEITSE